MKYNVQNINNTSMLNNILFNSFNPNRKRFHQSQSTTFNVIEDDKMFKIELIAPGLDKNDFNIKIDKNQLNISVNKSKETGNKGKMIRQDFVPSNFNKSFTLPSTVDLDKIDGIYEAGILTLSLPLKKEIIRNMSREININ